MAMTHHICTTGLPSPTWDFLLSRKDSGWQGPHLVAHVWAVGGQSKCADQLEAKFTILFLRSSLMFWITNSLRLIFSKLVCQFEMGTFAEYINMVQAFNYSKQNCVWLDNFPLGHIISSVWDNVYDMTVLLHMEMHYNKKKHEVPFKSAKCAFSKDKHWQKTYILVHVAVYFCQEQHTQAETCLEADDSGNNFNIKNQTSYTVAFSDISCTACITTQTKPCFQFSLRAKQKWHKMFQLNLHTNKYARGLRVLKAYFNTQISISMPSQADFYAAHWNLVTNSHLAECHPLPSVDLCKVWILYTLV